MAGGLRTLILLLACNLFSTALGSGLRLGTQPSRARIQGRARAKTSVATQTAASDDDHPPRPVLPGTSNNPSKKYLISTFPKIKQVGYVHLPDTVWRPLTVGNVSDPRGLAVDSAHQRIFVADVAAGMIYWYYVIVQDDGLLKTDGQQHVAVDGYVAKWMACNGVGDLYFTGSKMNVTPPAENYPGVYRMDGAKINVGDAFNPVEVYSRSNTGSPDPNVWMPSGIAVDSFTIYWGNEEQGTQNGAIAKGPRQNIGKTTGIVTDTLSLQVDEVRGMAVTGERIFFLSPNGVFFIPKTQAQPVTDPTAGILVQPSEEWEPQSIAYDGDGTLYFSDRGKGIIYSLPEGGSTLYPLTKFVDAPQAYGCQILALTGMPQKMADANAAVAAQADESGALMTSREPGTLVVLLAAFGALFGFMHS